MVLGTLSVFPSDSIADEKLDLLSTTREYFFLIVGQGFISRLASLELTEICPCLQREPWD